MGFSVYVPGISRDQGIDENSSNFIDYTILCAARYRTIRRKSRCRTPTASDLRIAHSAYIYSAQSPVRYPCVFDDTRVAVCRVFNNLSLSVSLVRAHDAEPTERTNERTNEHEAGEASEQVGRRGSLLACAGTRYGEFI